MNEETKIKRLKVVLIIKIVVVALLWGLPTLLAPPSILKLFGVEFPPDPFYLRIFGAVQLGLVFLYWFAYQNPARNRDIIKYAVIDNTLATLAILLIGLKVLSPVGISNPIVWISAGLTAFFAVAFYILMPAAPSR